MMPPGGMEGLLGGWEGWEGERVRGWVA
jgi:hypothetical protein